MSAVNLLLAAVKKQAEKWSQHPALTDWRDLGNGAALLNFTAWICLCQNYSLITEQARVLKDMLSIEWHWKLDASFHA